MQRIAPAFRRAEQFHLGKVAVLNRTPLDWRKRRGPLAHLLQRLRHVRVRDVHSGHFERQVFVIAQLEFRKHFKNSAKLQRLALVEIELVHLWLRNGRQFLFGNRFFHALRHQRLQHFSLDVLREFSPDQRNWSFAAAESRHVRQPCELLRHALNLFRYFFGGNLQFQLAAARCFSHTAILSRENAQIRDETVAGLGGMRLVCGYVQARRSLSIEANQARIHPATRILSIGDTSSTVNLRYSYLSATSGSTRVALRAGM